MRICIKTALIPAGVVALLALGTACATKQMVIEQVAALDKKVNGVEASVEENQKRLQDHDERLTSIGTLVGQYDAQFKAVDGKLDEVRKAAQGKLLYQETIRNKDARFKFDSAELSLGIKTALDGFVQKLIAENKGIFLEIQGHTDSTGSEEWNLLLGKKRAEAVLEYLYKQHHIPLHRMQVISFGSSNPVGDNKKAEGRALNRRVEVLVYE
ncbi:MAG: OmpA family protein [Acidobacteriota bacterium]|nr:OmpA family protein [Acidobacteriota bacterium]